KTRKLERELLLVEDHVRVETPKRDLRGSDETEVMVCDGVDLCLGAARAVADAVQDLRLRDVRRDEACEPVFDQHVEGKTLKGKLEQDGSVFEEIPFLTRHPRAAIEIEEIELCAERQVVEGLEVERPGRPPPSELPEVVFAAHGCIGMNEIGNRRHGLGEGSLGQRELGLE